MVEGVEDGDGIGNNPLRSLSSLHIQFKSNILSNLGDSWPKAGKGNTIPALNPLFETMSRSSSLGSLDSGRIPGSSSSQPVTHLRPDGPAALDPDYISALKRDAVAVASSLVAVTADLSERLKPATAVTGEALRVYQGVVEETEESFAESLGQVGEFIAGMQKLSADMIPLSVVSKQVSALKNDLDTLEALVGALERQRK